MLPSSFNFFTVKCAILVSICTNGFAQTSKPTEREHHTLGVSDYKAVDINQSWQSKTFFSFESENSGLPSFTVVEGDINSMVKTSSSGDQLYVTLPYQDYLCVEAIFRYCVLQSKNKIYPAGYGPYFYGAYFHGYNSHFEEPFYKSQKSFFLVNELIEEINCSNGCLSSESKRTLVGVLIEFKKIVLR